MVEYDDAAPEGRSRERSRDRSEHKDAARPEDGAREGERSRDRGDRRDRDRDRPRSRDRERSRRHKSRSRSRTPPRRERRRKTGFDKMPDGVEAAPAPVGLPGLPGMPPIPGLPGLPGAPPVAGPPTQQATRHARRVYVGGLPPTATEQSIAMFMSQALAAVGGTTGQGDCVINVYINAEKKFAFVEFRTVEECSNAMALDGIMFEGVTVRVRRPNDYNPSAAAALGPSVPSPSLDLQAIGLQAGGAGNAADGPDRIFVGGLPYYWMEEQCKELLQSFGPIKAFDLVRDRETGNSKGYGFVVYQDPAVTDPACAGLNGMKIGDKTLTVRRATQAGQAKPENIEVLMQAQQQMAQMQAAMGGGFPIPQMPAIIDPLATPILALTNCFDLEELNDPEAYTEIFEDMQEECGKYGKVETLLIPKPTDENTSGLGKVIIKYTSSFDAGKAKAAMHGRRFGGKTVEAVYISEANYSAGVLQ